MEFGNKSIKTLMNIGTGKRLHTINELMLIECDMTRDAKMLIDQMITFITFMFNSIT
jgi:hypothetical protein